MVQVTDRPPEIAVVVYRFIVDHPGSHTYTIARALAIRTRDMSSILSSLELRGWLVYEDDNGRLYQFTLTPFA